MNGLTRPENFVSPNDKRLIVVSLFVASACVFGISSPLGTGLINQSIMDAITLPVGIIMLGISILMYFGIHVNQQHKFDELVRERNRRMSSIAIKKLLYRCRFRSDEDGTQWEMTNANNFNWSKAKMLVERTHDGESITEKIDLGPVPMGTTVTVKAQLVDIELARWRVMVVSKEGQLVDFPDRWQESEHSFQ
ncbi:hypothetical protein SCG7086_BU_00030 [Chlamydiales bacterium SCGC AG-110-P3]|nr:hypothetical protein SCG7086_BU_00030 [Chlamydiales bacterium SCGC AG-110-P3]